MGEVVDLNKFKVDKPVPVHDPIWTPTESQGVDELEFVGGPRDNTKAAVPREVDSMIVPGFFSGQLDTVDDEWPGKYRYERLQLPIGPDIMRYMGPCEHEPDEDPAIITINPDELPGNFQWEEP